MGLVAERAGQLCRTSRDRRTDAAGARRSVARRRSYGEGFATTEYLAATLLDQEWHRRSPADPAEWFHENGGLRRTNGDAFGTSLLPGVDLWTRWKPSPPCAAARPGSSRSSNAAAWSPPDPPGFDQASDPRPISRKEFTASWTMPVRPKRLRKNESAWLLTADGPAG